ncbi:multidrug effflux MFS transporter [Clostridium beijerinckii]|nr:multidrug effflux MFS transporter [Clostridium beijerinckii]NRT71368.1 DHA1 family bicyclomycin/chloramphenicol resistance-like MFS transporter [Clostridium beijerinckii]
MEIIKDNNVEKEKEQKYLGRKGFLAFITLLSAFIPLSTDIYLPALPKMVESLNTNTSIVNLTLILFFAFYALGTILWGPLSDKYGRRTILIIGITIYTIASISCVFSGNVYQLILFRILQAIGCGAATAVSTAIVKDSYSGRKLVTVLALVQSTAMLSPIISPVIGAMILSVLSWRGVFEVLGALGVLSLAGSIAMEETIEKRYTGSIINSISNIGVVSRNRGFMSLLITFSIMSIPSLSFISASSYIFVDSFGLSPKVYSYYFAANSVFFLLGPLAYVKLSRYYNKIPYITIAYIVMAISGFSMCITGNLSPVIFMISLIPASFFGSLIRPQTTSIMLNQIPKETGAASSLINCAWTLFGCVGMIVISSSFFNRIIIMGLMYLITSVISLILWRIFSKKHGYSIF